MTAPETPYVCEDCYVLLSMRFSSWQWAIGYQMHIVNHRLDRTNDLLSALVAPTPKEPSP